MRHNKMVLTVVGVLGLAAATEIFGDRPVNAQNGAAPGVINAGALTVSAKQSGEWIVRDRDEPGRQPYQVRLGSGSVEASSPSVPLGKRLVLQFMSARVESTSDTATPANFVMTQLVYPDLPTTSAPLLFFNFSPPAPTGFHEQIVSAPLTGYVDGGGYIRLVLVPGSLSQRFEASVIGYLVDCPDTAACAPVVRE
jgi:hypothetical protein